MLLFLLLLLLLLLLFQFLKPFPSGLAAILKSCEPLPTCWEGLSCAIWESERLVPTASKTWFPNTPLARARGAKGIAEWWWTGLVGEAAMAVQQFLKMKEDINEAPTTCTLFHGLSPQFAKKIGLNRDVEIPLHVVEAEISRKGCVLPILDLCGDSVTFIQGVRDVMISSASRCSFVKHLV